MDVRTGSKLWGYSKRPKNWKRIMNEEIGQGLESEASMDEIDPSHESGARIPEEAPEDDKPEDDEIDPSHESGARIIPEGEDNRMVEALIDPSHESGARIGRGLESEASIEKPKITATVSNPASRSRPLVDSSFSHI